MLQNSIFKVSQDLMTKILNLLPNSYINQSYVCGEIKNGDLNSKINSNPIQSFEHQAAEGRRKGITKMKTQRMEPQDAEAFPLVSWKDAAAALKVFTTERVSELKIEHEGDDLIIARIETCNTRISEMKVWRMYQPKIQKHFLEFLCSFRPGKRYHTSSLTSPFTRIIISDIK